MKKWIPNSLTALNLCCGVIAIMLVDPIWSTALILMAAILDLLDGLLARTLEVDSELGKQLDSLADLISFGLAPAFVLQALFPMEFWLAITVVVVASLCAALRLANFNVMESRKDFIGLPTPAHGMTLLGLVLTDISNNAMTSHFIAMIAILVSILMIIPFSYPSFKSLAKKKLSILPMALGVITAVFVMFFDWTYCVIAGMGVYIISSRFTSFFS